MEFLGFQRVKIDDLVSVSAVPAEIKTKTEIKTETIPKVKNSKIKIVRPPASVPQEQKVAQKVEQKVEPIANQYTKKIAIPQEKVKFTKKEIITPPVQSQPIDIPKLKAVSIVPKTPVTSFEEEYLKIYDIPDDTDVQTPVEIAPKPSGPQRKYLLESYDSMSSYRRPYTKRIYTK
jgi:hypothetical protein